ncbi:MAG: alpha/beta hydrolase [Nitrososphaera sp.]|nr:alpha/beta hydrolase [Nitrososphaera sp.]
MNGNRDFKRKYPHLIVAFSSFILLGGFPLATITGDSNAMQQASGAVDKRSDATQTSAANTNSSTSMTTNRTNIILVHGLWADGSSWSKVIPILEKAGHKVIAVQLPLHSLADDVATVKRAVSLVGGPTILVGHSYGGFVITNAGYNNQNVTGLVYASAFAPDEGESTATFVTQATLPPGLLVFDSGGFAYLNPEMFHEAFVQDANTTEAETLAALQKPAHQSLFTEPSGPPAWKDLPTWFEVSESDHIIPPDAQRQFAERMDATTISLNSSHASPVSHPNEIAELILDAAKESNG